MLRLLRLILATWRLSSLLSQEQGPYQIFTRIREQHQGTEFGKGLECVYCNTIWIAAFVIVLDRYYPSLIDILAISTGAILIDKAAQ